MNSAMSRILAGLYRAAIVGAWALLLLAVARLWWR